MFTFPIPKYIKDTNIGNEDYMSVFIKQENLVNNQLYDEQEVNRVNKIIDENKRNKSSVIDFSKIKFSAINKYPKEIKLFDWIYTICFDECNLFKLDSLPRNAKFLSAKNNEIYSITEMPQNLTSLDLTKNNLEDGKIEFSSELEKVIIVDNQFKNIPKFGKKIKVLNMKNNLVTHVDYINPSITDLNLAINSIVSIKFLQIT